MKYKTEKEIFKVIENFENGTIERGKWGHPEHLILAYHYSVKNDFEIALNKMRIGIFNLLRAFEIDLTKEMPYHETMTVFWMKTVFKFAQTHPTNSMVKNIDRIINKFDKDYPFQFYSRELLFSEKARKEYVSPDK